MPLGLMRHAVVALVMGMVVPGAAHAHMALLRASPVADASLEAAPVEIRLTFSERPEPLLTRITLTSPLGSLIELDSVRISGNVVSAAILGHLVAGTYTVEWRTAGRDGHPIRGAYQFSINVDATGVVPAPQDGETVLPAPGLPTPAVSEAPALLVPLTVFLRWLALVGAITAIGAVAFRATILTRLQGSAESGAPPEYMPRVTLSVAALGAAAMTVVFMSGIGQLLLQLAGTGDAGVPPDGAMVASLITSTAWGRAWLTQIVMASVALLGFALVRRRLAAGWGLAGVGAVGLALGLALSGHSVAVPQRAGVTVLAHVVHVVAASGWLGSLLVIVLVAIPHALRLEREERWTVAARVVRRFSPVALALATVVVAAGVFLAWTHVGSLEALRTSEYGRVLILKIGLVVVAVAAGAYNRLRVQPKLGVAETTRHLQRSAGFEVVAALFVIAVTAVLVGTPTPLR